MFRNELLAAHHQENIMKTFCLLIVCAENIIGKTCFDAHLNRINKINCLLNGGVFCLKAISNFFHQILSLQNSLKEKYFN
jgi:hypothetical protein